MIGLRLEARAEPSRRMAWASPFIAAALMFGSAFVLFSLLGSSPIDALRAFFIAPLTTAYGVGEWLLKATPLMLCAVGLAIGFRANVWNIGAEGQLTMGAIAGGGVALFWPLPDAAMLPVMIVAGILGGMLWAAIPALLRTRFNASEILVSLMLVYVAQLTLSWLVHGAWRDPEGFNFPQSAMFSQAATLPLLVEGARTHIGLPIALILTVVAWLLVSRTAAGYRMRVAGLAPDAARYAGFSEARNVWLALLIGGGAAGLAGVFEVAGPIGQLQPSVSPGYGFAAIIVAFVGRLHPAGIVLASLLMSLLYIGGETAQLELGLPAAVTGLFQGLLLFYLLAADLFIHYRVRRARARIVRPGAPA
ncbi:ABC transporter permease [soil metagenome]